MFRLAIMSAGPSTSACTRGPAAIASMLVSPCAFSICASMPIRPTGSPWVVSSWVSSRSSAWMCETSVTFGSTMRSSDAPAVDTTSMTSAWVHGVVQSLTRTPRS